MGAKPRQDGFTLLEMVIAIGIFAVIAAIAHLTLEQFLTADRRLEQQARSLRELQLAFVQLERDLRFVTPRPVRDGLGEREPALLADPTQPPAFGELVRLTVSQPDPGGTGQRLRRVAWRFADGALKRVVWSELDRDFDTPERGRSILGGLAGVRLTFWHREQDDGLRATDAWTRDDALPAAAEIVVDGDDGRRYRRLLLLPAAG